MVVFHINSKEVTAKYQIQTFYSIYVFGFYKIKFYHVQGFKKL